MIQERSWGSVVFDAANYVLIALVATTCIVPMINMWAVSFSGYLPAEAHLVKLWPMDFRTTNYRAVLDAGQFMRSAVISVLRTTMGTLIGLIVTALAAYPLSLERRFRGQSLVKWMIIFSALFSGGLIPRYITYKHLRILNTLWVLVLPGAVNMFYIIIMLNCFRQLPPEMAEAATIDGASHWQILFRVYLPLSLPTLATLTLFAAVGHWNSWFDGLIFMRDPSKYPLPSYLFRFLTGHQEHMQEIMDRRDYINVVAKRGIQAALIMMTTLPIILVYPLLQRYFIHGLTLGSVKG